MTLFHRLRRATPFVLLALFATGCEADMKEGHPAAWTLLLFLFALGAMVVATPVKREKRLKRPKED